MVIKGVACAGASRLAAHLTRTDTNERVKLLEFRGVAAEDLRGALTEMEAVAAGTRTKKPFYHASISSRADERLTDEQRTYAIDRLEAELGLSGQARVVVVHEKKDREHFHIVWSRIDLERMTAISDSHNYRKHELVARSLEREFGHERVQGAHVEREGQARPQRTPSHAEMLQAERTGLSPQQIKEQVTELWRGTGSGQAFAAALSDAGFILARGDRRDFVVIDPRGGTHSLSRRVEDANAQDIRNRMADIDAARLPTVAEAKKIQRDRQSRDAARVPETARNLEPSRAPERETPKLDAGRKEATVESPRGANDASRATGSAIKALADVASGIAGLFESLLGGEAHKPQTPEERADVARAQDEAAAERADAAATEAEQIQKIGGGDPEKHRQQLLREFGRESDDELRRDHENSRERGRSR